ncbi:hypothetical protein OH492_26845 [Vibrio chagasii]|nr:hypothetical protein [Vibrio chagasii]
MRYNEYIRDLGEGMEPVIPINYYPNGNFEQQTGRELAQPPVTYCSQTG